MVYLYSTVNEIYFGNKKTLAQISSYKNSYCFQQMAVYCKQQKLAYDKLCQLSHKVSLFHTTKLSALAHTDIKRRRIVPLFFLQRPPHIPLMPTVWRALHQQSSCAEDGRVQTSAYLTSLVTFVSTCRQIPRHYFKWSHELFLRHLHVIPTDEVGWTPLLLT